MIKKILKSTAIIVVMVFMFTNMSFSFSLVLLASAEIEMNSNLKNQRAEEDAKKDSLHKSFTGNWDKAESIGVVPPYNHFHNDVEDYIISKYYNWALEDEKVKTYKPGMAPIDNKSGEGRADLYLERGDKAFYWEIKPGSYLSFSKYFKALEQLGSLCRIEQQRSQRSDKQYACRNGHS